METLVVAQHKNQYCSRVKSQGPVQYGSSPSTGFRGINCRSFQSAAGILPCPFMDNNSPGFKEACSSPKTPSPYVNSGFESKTRSRTTAKSTPIAIDAKLSSKKKYFGEDVSEESLSFSELWAGPAYSNSPPPSSLPIPKFSIRPKRTVSLELPGSPPDYDVHPMAKSAPASPTREYSPFTRDIFHGADSATETLRRILNLDIHDE